MLKDNNSGLKIDQVLNNDDFTKSTYNYGLALLKALMCFEVILIHFWTETNIPIFLLPFSGLRRIPVPVFMFLSFFFLGKNKINKFFFKERFFRVIWPQIGWAILYYIILYYIRDNLRITDLFWQIFTGHSYNINTTMWFQTNLIIFTITYYIIYILIPEKYTITTVMVITIFALIFQYSEINFKIFDKMIYEFKYPFGRICEMIPYATFGWIIGKYDIFDKLKNKRYQTLIVFLLFSLFSFSYEFINSAKGFGYSENNNILLSFFIIGFVYLLPFEKILENHTKISNIIKFITSFTLGIYCSHRLVGEILNKITSNFKISGKFCFCIFIYLVSFILCFMISKIPSKLTKGLVK